MHLRPKSLDEAMAFLSEERAVVMAGGTDLYPAFVDRPPPARILDITAISGLRGIVREADHWRIGGATTWTDIARASLPPAFHALKAAAREIGSLQIQNRATIAGNLCNASPAADSVPPLLALDASVELASASGTRTLPLADFIKGNRRTEKRPDELLTAVLIPGIAEQARSVFLKLGARRYLVISIVMVAANILRTADGRIAHARVAVGSASAVATRLANLEAALASAPAHTPAGSVVAEAHLAPLAPIDDVRASGAYRRDAALTLVRRALAEADGDA
ncbi:MAG: xanthine dehydrogenase family protein subunit M [Rhizobiales bacterium]|nr:xanthine dehydrogenase family protein subunit M [Hyphomicrobiales bacterium]MBN9008961.1 xanthine dehydrogenase family protein subunit M [Hyphomicrobiales bacterium]